jgi:hypothetical protein
MVMRQLKGAVVGIAVALVVLAGCGAKGNDTGTSESGASAPMKGEASDGKSSSGAPQSQGKPAEGQPAQDDPTITRAIIKTGSLTVEADNVDAKRQQAITIITGLKGQVASEDTGSSDDEGRITRANLVLKVPTASYETAIQQLSGLGKRLQIHQESDDVTEQVVDVASRIESQRASLERMRLLLGKANTIGDIVSVESELTRREADLESLLAKQKNLALQTELATLALTLTEKGKPPAVAKEPDRGFLAGLNGGWNAFTATFGALATAIGAILPFAVLLALIVVPLWLFRHRLRRQPAGAPQAPDAGQ